MWWRARDTRATFPKGQTVSKRETTKNLPAFKNLSGLLNMLKYTVRRSDSVKLILEFRIEKTSNNFRRIFSRAENSRNKNTFRLEI